MGGHVFWKVRADQYNFLLLAKWEKISDFMILAKILTCSKMDENLRRCSPRDAPRILKIWSKNINQSLGYWHFKSWNVTSLDYLSGTCYILFFWTPCIYTFLVYISWKWYNCWMSRKFSGDYKTTYTCLS